MSKVNSVLNFMEKSLLLAGFISTLGIMFLTTFDLLSRKFLGYSIPSLYEFTEDYLMVCLVFSTISYVYTRGGHVRVTILEKYYPPYFIKPLEKLFKILAFMLFFFIMVKGWEIAAQAYKFNEVSSSSLRYPMAPALALVPLGSAMVCIRIFQSLFTTSWGLETQPEDSVVD